MHVRRARWMVSPCPAHHTNDDVRHRSSCDGDGLKQEERARAARLTWLSADEPDAMLVPLTIHFAVPYNALRKTFLVEPTAVVGDLGWRHLMAVSITSLNRMGTRVSQSIQVLCGAIKRAIYDRPQCTQRC
jgi:hypothetical protein